MKDSIEAAMAEMNEHRKLLSLCCNAPVVAGGSGMTHYHICSKCGKACDTKRG